MVNDTHSLPCRRVTDSSHIRNLMRPFSLSSSGSQATVASWDKWLAVLLLLSVALNITLSISLHGLRAKAMQEQSLQPGTHLERLTFADVEGRSMGVTFLGSKRPTIIYVFSPACSWCNKNATNFNRLVGWGAGEYRFLGLCLDRTKLRTTVSGSYRPEGIPIGTDPSASEIKRLRLGATPHTILVGTDGRVMRSWVGAYDLALCREIEAELRIPKGLLTPVEN